VFGANVNEDVNDVHGVLLVVWERHAFF
jgi:hypothetical protein